MGAHDGQPDIPANPTSLFFFSNNIEGIKGPPPHQPTISGKEKGLTSLQL